MTGFKFDWVTLFKASGRLMAQLGFNGFEMVSRAVHSGEVPVRALKDDLDSIFGAMSKWTGPNALITARQIWCPLYLLIKGKIRRGGVR
jgi:hypothetical protein